MTDVLRRVVAYHHLGPEEVALRVEREIRGDWGGDEVYIAKNGESCAGRRSARDRAIIDDYRRGERVELLARRYRRSLRRIWQIVKGAS